MAGLLPALAVKSMRYELPVSQSFVIDPVQLREEVEKLRSMQKELESQLAKERYRIKHLIRAVGELVALKGNAGGFDRPSPLPSA